MRRQRWVAAAFVAYFSTGVKASAAEPPRKPTEPRQTCSVDLNDLDLHEVTRELPDLNGDGRADYALSTSCGVTGNCQRLVLVTDGLHCPRLVAVLFGETPVRLDSKHFGFHDIAIFGDGGCAGTEGVLVRYQYDGSNYVVAETIQCSCLAEPSATPRDPRCDTWRPR